MAPCTSRPPGCRRRSAPGRCVSGCWTRRWSAWSRSAGAVRRPRWCPSAPGSAAVRSCTTSRPRARWCWPPSSTSSDVRGDELAARRGRAAGRPAPHPGRAGDARRRTSPARCSPRRSSSGSRPAPTRSCARRSARSSSGSAARPTAPPSSCSASTSPGPACASWCRPPSTWSAASGWPHTLTDDTARRNRILDQWARVLDARIREASDGRAARRGARRPRRRGRPARGPGRAARRRAGWRAATPAAGWDVAHQVAHLAWTDEVAVLAAHRQGGAGTRSCWPPWRTPTGSSTRWRPRVPRCRARSCWRAGAPRAPGLAEALRTLPEGTRIPWYGPPMSATSMATARFMETWAHARDVAAAPRRRAAGRRPGAARRPPRGAHPRLRLRQPRPRRRRRRSPRRADAPAAAPLRVRARGRGQSVTRVGARLRAARHPAAPPAPTPTSPPTGADADQWLDDRAGVRRPDRARDGPAGGATCCRVGNCSGFYGDRLSAMREMLHRRGARRAHRRLPRRADHADPRPGPDEGRLAAAMPARSSARPRTASGSRSSRACGSSQRRRPQPGRPRRAGCARWPQGSGSTRGSRTCRATTCVDRAALARDRGPPLTANAYLGAFGIAAALAAGADVVVTGRVTDASLVVGPAVARFGWTPDVVRRARRRRRSRGTSSSAAPRRRAATSPASGARRDTTRSASRSPRSRPTGPA